jgi:hypothetical protein
VIAIIDRGFLRNTPVEVNAIQITPETIEFDCIECGGTGDWTPYMYPGYTGPRVDCVECKGTGRTFA